MALITIIIQDINADTVDFQVFAEPGIPGPRNRDEPTTAETVAMKLNAVAESMGTVSDVQTRIVKEEEK